ncbi:MAG: 4Fe-4S dicluster domain-containing protein [Calditrichaeota bacterium]|nr:MAG: 4Fe-4S dicluster domain-containing protein [Calditrichota bacterium]
MESMIIWGSVILISALVVVPYAVKFGKQQKEHKARKEEAVRLGADKPVAQYPQIDETRCIGCATCVAACPEHDVLGIVMGRATVINGLKCVGHAKCAEACPVGAIVVGLGDISKRDDIPLMDDYGMTNLPGLYIAGELGGLALIKNAIAQGKKVVDRIAELYTPQAQNDVYDIIVVGAGPAGISAALTAKMHNFNTLVLDQQGFGGTILQYPRKKLVMTHPVEIPLWGKLQKFEYEKEELVEIWEEIYKKFELNVKLGEKLETIERPNGYFNVRTQNGEYKAHNVVLALGRRGTPRKLGVPGEESKKVMYKLIDAESYTNNHILVVGGGDSAVEAAMGLSHQPGNVVTISYRKDKFFRIKKRNEERLNAVVKEGKIKLMMSSNVVEIGDDYVLLKDESGEQRIQNDYVFVFAGGEPPFKLMKKMGIQFGGEQG